MTILEQREAIVTEARTWIRTPYRHEARVKGAGVDCAQILAAVYPVVFPKLAEIVIEHYPHDWHLHKDDERYLNIVRDYASEVETPLPGDIVVFRFGRAFAHGGIVTGGTHLVHSYMQAGCVIEENYINNHELTGRVHRYFSPWLKLYGKVED